MPSLPVPIGEALPARTEALADASDRARDYARAEKALATRQSYLKGWRLFEAWCRSVGASSLPASVGTVRSYVAKLADDGLSVSTINGRCAAIGYVHRAAGLEVPTGAEAVKAVLRGIRRTVGTKPRRKAPATDKAVKAMVKPIPDTMSGKRDRAMILLGFAAALRRSELVALTTGDIERVPEGVVVHLRRSKTDQEGKGREIAVPFGSKLKVVQALDAWLAAAKITSGPLFRAVDKGANVGSAPLQGRAVAEVVKRWAEAAKLDPRCFSGHSLRAGFVSTALHNDADVLAVMKVTGHRSVDTVQIYDRRTAWENHAGKRFL